MNTSEYCLLPKKGTYGVHKITDGKISPRAAFRADTREEAAQWIIERSEPDQAGEKWPHFPTHRWISKNL